jgi:hypothetical protein
MKKLRQLARDRTEINREQQSARPRNGLVEGLAVLGTFGLMCINFACATPGSSTKMGANNASKPSSTCASSKRHVKYLSIKDARNVTTFRMSEANITERLVGGISYVTAKAVVKVERNGKLIPIEEYQALMRSQAHPGRELNFHWIFMEKIKGKADEYLILNPKWTREPKTGWVYLPDGSGNVIRPDGLVCDPVSREPVKGAGTAQEPQKYIARLLRNHPLPSGKIGDAIVSGTSGKGKVLARIAPGPGGTVTRVPYPRDMRPEVTEQIASFSTRPSKTRASTGGEIAAALYIVPRKFDF